MFKKILSYICVSTLLIVSIISISASENDEKMTLSIDSIEVVDETTLLNLNNNEYMFFETKKNRDEFIEEIRNIEVSTYACLPGDPGYPHCSGTTVIKTELQTLSGAVNTGELNSKNYLCGNSGWVWGPGTVSYSAGAGVSAQYTYNGTFSLNFSYQVTVGASYPVPAGKRGNIKYRANFRLTPQRYKYTLSDGSVTYSGKFYTRKFLYGGTYAVYL